MKAPSLLVKKLWPRLNFLNVGQTSRSRSRGQKSWYHVKGRETSNTHVQYESSISHGKKVMAKVKGFCSRIKRRRGRRHQGYDITSPDIRPGSQKIRR